MSAPGRILPTLNARAAPLAPAAAQLELLARRAPGDFAARCAGGAPVTGALEVLQLNLGKRCNLTCRHCHVDAGPDRGEVMDDATLDACLAFLERSSAPVLDLTGGAPELHPRFREIIRRAAKPGRRIIDRCNLTVLNLPSYSDLPEFLAAHRVEIAASLPAPDAARTDAQRGAGVFAESIAALKRLNALGYGVEGSGLVLDLVANPVGALLPPPQAALEREWKARLAREHRVVFNRLWALANLPVSRFLEFLEARGMTADYLARLADAFNPAALPGLMCRSTLSVGWDGRLYDCDFNQMLELAIGPTIRELAPADYAGRAVRTAPHCFGCAAGQGSGCGGATVSAME